MAIQDRKGKIHGKLSNTVYRTAGDKQIMQVMPGRVKQTLATKLNALEFGLASTQARALREIMRHFYDECDSKMSLRLNTAVAACIRASGKEIGERDLHDADLRPLIGFPFNTDAPFERLVSVRPVIERMSDGEFRFSLPTFNILKDIVYPTDSPRMDLEFTIAIVAFHFREEAGYMWLIDHASFTFANQDKQAEINWFSRRQLPAGAIAFVVLSLRYASMNWLNQRIPTTDKHFYPTIILDAFHITAEMAATQEKNPAFDDPVGEETEIHSNTTQILADIAQLRTKVKSVRK